MHQFLSATYSQSRPATHSLHDSGILSNCTACVLAWVASLTYNLSHYDLFIIREGSGGTAPSFVRFWERVLMSRRHLGVGTGMKPSSLGCSPPAYTSVLRYRDVSEWVSARYRFRILFTALQNPSEGDGVVRSHQSNTGRHVPPPNRIHVASRRNVVICRLV